MLISKQALDSRLIEDLQRNYLYFKSGGKEGLEADWSHEKHRNIDISDEALTKAFLTETDLSGSCLDRLDAAYALADGIQLIKASIQESCWRKAELAKSNFSGVQGYKASFVKANLRDANFSDANLQCADFRETHCTRTNFAGACLKEAKFTFTRLRETNFNGANISGATFDKSSVHPNVKLKGVIGLEKANVISIRLPRKDINKPIEVIEGDEARAYLEKLAQ